MLKCYMKVSADHSYVVMLYEVAYRLHCFLFSLRIFKQVHLFVCVMGVSTGKSIIV